MDKTVSKESANWCCCDTGPVKNCGPECCIQLQCEICNIIVRICKDGWKKTGDTTLICSKCMKK